MQNALKALSISYLLTLPLLMLIPIGTGSLNNIHLLTLRGDYFIHILVFLPWMWAGYFLWKKRNVRIVWGIMGIVAAIWLEYIQLLLPYRAFNVNDLVAGVVGVLLSIGSLVVYRLRGRVC